MHNAEGQRIDYQEASNPDPEAAAAQAADKAARPITLADYNHPDQYYGNRSGIHPPAIKHNDFELKPHYLTLMGHTP